MKVKMKMKMKMKWITAGLLVCLCSPARAQEAPTEGPQATPAQTEAPKTEAAKTQEPNGKAIIQVFGNFHTGFGAGQDDRGFTLDRSYIGYEYKLGKGLSVKGVLDIGMSSDVSDYQRLAYIKNAMLSWKTGNLTLNGGLISTTQFNFQEKFWGYRYLMKSFQDEYKFGSSADLGVSVAYKFADWILADAMIVNGEGYKKIQKKDGLNYGLGVTLTPVKGFQIRLYGGLNGNGEADDRKYVTNLSAFMGYKHEKFTVGAEYNYMMNAAYMAGADRSGYSVFASVNLPKEISLYARFDDLYSKNDWNKAKDESVAIVGAQFKLGKYVKLAPNFRMAVPKADGASNRYAAYVNFYFGL